MDHNTRPFTNFERKPWKTTRVRSPGKSPTEWIRNLTPVPKSVSAFLSHTKPTNLFMLFIVFHTLSLFIPNMHAHSQPQLPNSQPSPFLFWPLSFIPLSFIFLMMNHAAINNKASARIQPNHHNHQCLSQSF